MTAAQARRTHFNSYGTFRMAALHVFGSRIMGVITYLSLKYFQVIICDTVTTTVVAVCKKMMQVYFVYSNFISTRYGYRNMPTFFNYSNVPHDNSVGVSTNTQILCKMISSYISMCFRVWINAKKGYAHDDRATKSCGAFALRAYGWRQSTRAAAARGDK